MLKPVVFIIFTIGILSSAIAGEAEVPVTDYPAVAAAINKTLHTWLYDPAELETPAYQRLETQVEALALSAASDEAFIEGFREIWKDGPFSHVELRKAQQPAAELASYFDTLRVGGGGAQLTWMDNVAILTVNTMMGLDTIEEIDAAYIEIASHGASALMIDLRENPGGAFAVRPLVAHLLSEKFDAGVFVSRQWYATNDRPPSAVEMQAVEPWEGWSITAFWADVQKNALTGISFIPVEPVYTGPVYVLTSKRTASAAELATDALRGSGRALIIGENTAGEMLSQKIFDLPGGFHLSLPVADYYSISNGRIEGSGIKPDIGTDAADALNTALSIKLGNGS
jgi:hypothetical protein